MPDAPAWAECSVELRSAPDGIEGLGFPREHNFAFEACVGAIRPGAPLSSPGCTFSFILTDASGNLYTGTAAHCVGIGQRVATTVIGSFGTVVTDGALGVDYALIKIDADKHHRVNPTMCAWGGPIGPDPGNRPAGDILLEYAWGFVTSATAQTRTRALVQMESNANQVSWTGVGSGGDSGGPIVSIEGYAVGSHTAGLTPAAGVVLEYGPSFARMLASGRAAVPTLTLVTGDPSSVETTARALRDV